MSLLNTTATPQFLAEPPDWSKPVSVETAWQTDVMQARDGSEQRSRRRHQPRHTISYTLAALNVGQFSARRAKSLLEQMNAVVVPVWTDEFWATVAFDETEFEVGILDEGDLNLALQKFKIGGFAYISQPGKTSVFRRILAIGESTITFAAGASETFTSGACIQPCITGLPSDGANFTAAKLDDTDEAVVIEEL